ncbi:hypothetical protein ElyMa_002425300 [Elysia marginata]|uniref:Uncharacterized protein n=1 Tax=Elysia marginata TaxID=1093978 RepID=A0AAV4GIG9_9GAST|nr:hypothetical protein ElyMa_002425300 [Elysia marginata]
MFVDLTEEVNLTEEIDIFYVLYGVEMFIVLTLILWTFGNLMEHIRLLMRQERMRQDQKLQAEVLKGHINFGNRFHTVQ